MSIDFTFFGATLRTFGVFPRGRHASITLPYGNYVAEIHTCVG